MKKRILFSVIFAILVTAVVALSDFVPDVIVTSPNGIWTDTRAYSTINTAVAAIGTNDRDIYIVRQEATTALTIPSNVSLHFFASGSIANTGQLTLNTRQIFAADHQIFTGTGDIDFSPGSVIRSAWFSSAVEAFYRTTDDNITLVISKSAFITANRSVGDNVNLRWEAPNNRLTANAGYTLSNIKKIEAGNFQLFAGAGDFAFLDGSRLKLDWFARLRSAINWIGSSKVTLVISGSNTVDYNETTPSTLLLDLNSENGLFNISAGVTLTIYSSGKIISSLDKQIVSGDGLLRFTNSGVVSSEWFGAVGDASTNDYTSFRSAYDCLLNSSGGIFKLLTKTYRIDSPISLGLAGNLDIPITFQGDSGSLNEGTVLYIPSITAGHALFEQNQGDYVYNHKFKDFMVLGGTSSVGNADAFRLEYINNFHLEGLQIKYCNVGVYITGQDIDRVSFKKSKFNSNGQDILFSASAAGYQIDFEDIDFSNTQNDASVNALSGCNLKEVYFKNCSWVECQHAAIELEDGSSFKQLTIENGYSEQCCKTSGDYAFDFMGDVQSLLVTGSGLVDNNPDEAEIRIGNARNSVFISNELGINNTVRSFDLGNGTGSVYNLTLINNTLWDDSGGDEVSILGSSTVRNLVTLSNIPNELDSGVDPVFSISNYYGENLLGIKLLERSETRALTANDTFTASDSHIFRMYGADGSYNFNPSGTFQVGYTVEIFNLEGVHTVTFDSTGLNYTIPAHGTAKFIWGGVAWRKLYTGTIN